MILCNGKEFAILTVLSTVDTALEIEFTNDEVPLEVEDNCISSHVDGDEYDSIGTDGEAPDLVMCLEGEDWWGIGG